MQRILVITNNRKEWGFFTETLQWKCSKQNQPYKQVAEAFHDLVANIRYSVIYNNQFMQDRLAGQLFDDYVLLCDEKNVDIGLVMSYIRGDKL